MSMNIQVPKMRHKISEKKNFFGYILFNYCQFILGIVTDKKY